MKKESNKWLVLGVGLLMSSGFTGLKADFDLAETLKVVMSIQQLEKTFQGSLKTKLDTLVAKEKAAPKDQQYLYALQIIFNLLQQAIAPSMLLADKFFSLVPGQLYQGKSYQDKFLKFRAVVHEMNEDSAIMKEAFTALVASLKAKKAAAKQAALAQKELGELNQVIAESTEIAQETIQPTAQTSAADRKYEQTIEILTKIDDLIKRRKTFKEKVAKYKEAMNNAPEDQKALPALRILNTLAQPLADIFYLIERVTYALGQIALALDPGKVTGIPQLFDQINDFTKSMRDNTQLVQSSIKELIAELKADALKVIAEQTSVQLPAETEQPQPVAVEGEPQYGS